jgi:hypothetical protein
MLSAMSEDIYYTYLPGNFMFIPLSHKLSLPGAADSVKKHGEGVSTSFRFCDEI